MGKNKKQKFKDMSQFPHVFEFTRFEELLKHDNPLKSHWDDQFFKNDKPIVLELGCGKGEYSVGLAELYPEKNFIGVDIKGARMWTGAKDSAEKGLKNVAFLRTHIEFITRFFAPGEVSEIWLTFPDPQMKKVTKRLTSTRFMVDYQKFLKVDGKIHLKTDSQFMYRYTLEMARSSHLPVKIETDDLYHCGWADKILSIQTFYENQWLQRGLTIKYIQFEMPFGVDWKEPEVEIEPDSYRSFGRRVRNLPTGKQTEKL
jgi:tRNA (guanine-N7-)-methyltransferase